MDPDLPVSSTERDKSQTAPVISMSTRIDSANTPRSSSSPYKEVFGTPLSHPTTSSPVRLSTPSSRANTPSHERQKAPILQTRRSSSNLSANHGATPQFRRTSSNLNPDSPILGMKNSTERPVMTANTVAKEYFRKELEYHDKAESEVIVLVHDSCYGHRFSRPRTSKAALSTIVEKPERIHATLLGASTAYVRLGDRHSAGSYGPSPERSINTTSKPPFTLRKTSRSVPLNHPSVIQVHGMKWMEELQIMCDSAEAKLAMNGKELTRPIGYGKTEAGNSLPKLHEGDLYLCSESLAALEGCLGGVCDAVDAVFQPDHTKRAFVCIRPPGHHCSSDYPSGFCWLNNVHVGISYAAMTHNLTHAAIFDFDLHHGDGSQTIAWNHNRDAQSLPKNAPAHKKTPIAYYSLHDINSYPCEWGDEEKVRHASLCLHNAHGQSIWNVHLESWTSLDEFWKLYESKYIVLLQKARSFLQHHAKLLRQAGTTPKGAIFISAGFDASQWEGAGMQRHNVNVPTEFYARFTEDVVKLAEDPDLGVEARIVSVLEGGYSDRALTSGVLSHLCGLTYSADHTKQPITHAHEIYKLANGFKPSHDRSWWSESNLETLEAMVAGNLPPPVTKKDKQPGNYSSPTHASNARMTDQARERRSLSAQLESMLQLDSMPTEPPPEVDWVTASYELCQLMIPHNRQTFSCRHDELNAEATRVRRERQSAIGLPSSDGEPMQLRTRRNKAISVEGVRASSRTTNRRTTIAAVSDLPDPSSVDPVKARPRRRSSAASSILSNFQNMNIKSDDDILVNAVTSNQQEVTAANSMKPPVVKKSKPLAPRKTNSRVNSPAKARPGSKSRITPSINHQDTLDARSDDPSNMSSSPPARMSDTKVSVSGEMDDLTKGMKKVSIKLNLPTPEQHAVNQKKAEEERQKKVRAPRKPPVPRLVRTKPPAASRYDTQSHQDAPEGQAKSSPVQLPTSENIDSSKPVEQLPQSNQSSYAMNTQLRPRGEIPVQSPWTSESDSPVVDFEQPITSADQSQSTTAPLAGLVPGTFTPAMRDIENATLPASDPTIESVPAEILSPKRTKADLPVFTAPSSIPFSKQEFGSSDENLNIEVSEPFI